MEKLKKLLIIVSLIVTAILILLGTIENGILLTILSLVIIYLFVNNVKIKKFPIFLILFCLLTKIISVVILNVNILADYYHMYEASIRLIGGDYSFYKEAYFMTWGYQLFHVFYQALMLKIFNNVLFLKILNCIYSTVITVIIYQIVKKVSSEKSARIVSLLYAISLYPLYLNCVLGNQQLSFMFLIIGIYIFLFKKQDVKNLIIVGLLIGLSNLERPEGIIYILTIIIYLIVTNKKALDIAKKVFIILLTYFIVTKVPSYIMIKQGINEIGLNNTNPEWKFLMGFNDKSNGKNSMEDEKYFGDVERQKDVIIKRVTNIKALPKLMYNKVKIQWLYDDLEDTFNVKNSTQFSDKFMLVFLNYVKIINLVIIVIMFIGILKTKTFDNTYYFWIINMLIYFGVYLLIEVSARYYFNPQISVLITSSLGIELILNKISKPKKKTRYRKQKKQ